MCFDYALHNAAGGPNFFRNCNQLLFRSKGAWNAASVWKSVSL